MATVSMGRGAMHGRDLNHNNNNEVAIVLLCSTVLVYFVAIAPTNHDATWSILTMCTVVTCMPIMCMTPIILLLSRTDMCSCAEFLKI
jgi:hypothetical protein